MEFCSQCGCYVQSNTGGKACGHASIATTTAGSPYPPPPAPYCPRCAEKDKRIESLEDEVERLRARL